MAMRSRKMPGLVLPPLPEGAIGWKVYNSLPAEPVFFEFVGDEEAVDAVASKFADDVEAFTAGDA